MEALTLACLQHLPTAVLFVLDLTGGCGMSVPHQWAVRQDLRQRFPAKPWLDVFSKADLLDSVFGAAYGGGRAPAESAIYATADVQSLTDMHVQLDGQVADLRANASANAFPDQDHAAAHRNYQAGSARTLDAVAVAVALPTAKRVSSMTESGLQALMDAVMLMLST